MKTCYRYRTRRGTFSIELRRGAWRLLLDGDEFDGPFHTPFHALDDLVSGACAWPSTWDPSALDISDDLGDWDA